MKKLTVDMLDVLTSIVAAEAHGRTVWMHGSAVAALQKRGLIELANHNGVLHWAITTAGREALKTGNDGARGRRC